MWHVHASSQHPRPVWHQPLVLDSMIWKDSLHLVFKRNHIKAQLKLLVGPIVSFVRGTCHFGFLVHIMNGPLQWSEYKLDKHWIKSILLMWSFLRCTGMGLWFPEPFCSLSLPSAHFLCVTAPFPVSVEAIREITQPPPVTPFSPLVSFSIFGPARLFPPFLYLLFFLACIQRLFLITWRSSAVSETKLQ